MRRLIVFAGSVALACASMQAPPGGEARKTPPALVRATPESGAVNVTAKTAVLEFDAIVDDGGPTGDMSRFVMISPDNEGANVSWHRERIEVRPKRGFRPGTAYSVTLLPGLSDLYRNSTKTSRTITFSTGPAIPAYAVHGRVFEWLSERPAVGALLQVVRRSDSLPYVGVSDSAGMFAIGPLDTGSYMVRAIIDVNRNRIIDPTEAWDSTGTVVTTESPFVEMLAVQRDTIGPRLLSVSASDSMTISASFDRLVNPAPALSPESFRVVGPDSQPLRIARVVTSAAFATAQAAQRAARDTTRRDTSTTRAPVSTVPSRPKPSIPPPTRDFVLQMDSAARLKPGVAYRVMATDIRGLRGPQRSTERSFTTTADSAKAPPRPPQSR